MSSSQTQGKRSNPADNLTSDSAAPFDLDRLLDSLDSVGEWSPPVIEKTIKRKNGRPGVPVIEWPASIRGLAESLNPVLVLPDHPPRNRPSGFTPLLVAAPRDLTKLGAAIDRYQGRNAGSSLFLSQLIHGVFNTPAGPLPMPSLVGGDPLPLSLLIKLLSKTGELYAETMYLQKLVGSNSILNTLSNRVNRYCYVDDAHNIRTSDVIV